MMQTRR